MNKPTRFKPKTGKLDSDKCVASVHDNGRWPGFHQCGNKRKPDTEWCGVHAILEVAEDSEKLWVVDDWSEDKPKLFCANIVKETARRITVDKSHNAFDWKNVIPKHSDGSPRFGARTREGALLKYLDARLRDVQSAKSALDEAKKILKIAEKLSKEG